MDSLLVLYNLLLWNICYRISIRTVAKNRFLKENVVSTSKFKVFFLFMFLYSLFIFFGGDDAEYRKFVEGGYVEILHYVDIGINSSIEPVYAFLAMLCQGNYILWKSVVYGLCLLLYYQTIKRLNLNLPSSMLFLTLCVLLSLGATRVVLALSIFTYAVTYISKERKILIIFGIALILVTYFFHGSMLVPIFLLPSILFKLTTRRVLIIIASLPIAIGIAHIGFDYLLNNNIFMESYAGAKFEDYTQNDGVAAGHSILTDTYMLLNYIIISIFLFVSISKDLKHRLPAHASFFVRICLFLAYFSIVIRFQNIPGSEIIFQRYFTMIPFLLWPALSSLSPIALRSNRMIKSSTILSIVKTNLLFLIQLYYNIIK